MSECNSVVFIEQCFVFVFAVCQYVSTLCIRPIIYNTGVLCVFDPLTYLFGLQLMLLIC